ncbi:hypothetical protein TrCOL_g6783 [Triparma columacea]|uniref:Uncharacterized protein n=1 Tax=Triparma columacea TaxID=722753 RepID=A0A9W7GD64_9STRA|nr:hypothetical protein TrCOL_g6783 [Triparma columacea]
MISTTVLAPIPAIADYGEYGVSNEAPTLYTGETIDICVKRGPLGACKKSERRTVQNDNDKASKYQKGQSDKVKEKDASMRLGTDGVATSDLIKTLQQRTDDNRERNLRIVEQKTFEANQPGYMGPFERKVLIQNFGDEGSVEASGFTLLDTPQAMRLKKAGYIEGRKFVKPVTKEIIDEAAVEEGNIFSRIGDTVRGILGGEVVEEPKVKVVEEPKVEVVEEPKVEVVEEPKVEVVEEPKVEVVEEPKVDVVGGS